MEESKMRQMQKKPKINPEAVRKEIAYLEARVEKETTLAQEGEGAINSGQEVSYLKEHFSSQVNGLRSQNGKYFVSDIALYSPEDMRNLCIKIVCSKYDDIVDKKFEIERLNAQLERYEKYNGKH